MNNLEERYNSLWRAYQRDEDSPAMRWVDIATHALHAIFPDTLDDFWVNACQLGLVRRALVKRLNFAPAGAALWPTFATAYNDIKVATPGVSDKFNQVRDNLEQALTEVAGHRWAGSVNRNRYGAPAISVPGEGVALLASTVQALGRVFAPEHELLSSHAINRVACNAPIISGVILQGVREATKRIAYGVKLLALDAPAAQPGV